MNQILVSEKLYITPELKRKKNRYKISFAVSLFLICLLTSYYIYAEWDRSKSEEVSKEILDNIKLEDDTVISNDKSIIVVDLEIGDSEGPININSMLAEQRKRVDEFNEVEPIVYQSKKGTSYITESVLKIPKINLSYPVLSETSEDLLKISINKLWGPEPNTEGNYCIVGHNYKNGKMFGGLSKLEIGDTIELTDLNGETLTYEVYNKYIVEPTDVTCTSQITDGKKEVTLITCTNYGKQRLVLKTREKVNP